MCQKLTWTNSADIFTVKHNLTFHANCLKRGISLHEMSNAVSLRKKNSKHGMMKLLYRALAHLFDVCKKFSTIGIKGLGFSQTLQDVFLAVVDLLNIKIF